MLRRYYETPFSILNLLQDCIVSILSLRFLFVLLNANSRNIIVRFVYETSQPFMEPFRSMFHPSIVSGFAIEWSTLVAITVCVTITALLSSFLAVLTQIVDDDDAMIYHRPRIRRHRHV